MSKNHYWRLFGAVFIGGALRGGMQALQVGLAQAGGAGQVTAGISSVGNQAVMQRLGRALDTRPTIEIDAGQLCNVLLTKPLSLEAMWQYGGQAHESRRPQRACVARVAASSRMRYAPGHAHPQTHGGPMQHPHEVDMVLAVLDTREMVVYGPDLPRPLGTEGEAMPMAVARIPIGRPESADVLKAYFAACGSVTWAKVLEAGRQVPRLERGMAAAPRRTQA